MPKTIWLVLFAGLLAGFESKCLAGDRPSDLTQYNWSATAAPNLAKDPPSKEVVEKFLRAVEISVWGESDLGEIGYVCSFRFANLRGNGSLSLVAGVGVSEQPCGDIYIIDKSKSGFEAYQSGGALGTGQDVSANIVDLRKDGHYEFLVYSTLGLIISGCTAVQASI